MAVCTALLVVLAGLLSVSPAAASQPEATPVLTLAESLELALEHSPRLGIAQSRARQALAQVDQAESLLKPRVDVFGTISEQTTSDLLAGLGVEDPDLASHSLATHGDSVTSGAVGMSYTQLIWPLGESRIQLEQARLAPEVARAQEALERAQLLRDVENAYLSVLEAQATLEWARLLERNAQEALRVVQDRLELGAATELDRLAAEAGALQARQARQAAEDGLELAWEALYQIMGVPRPEQLPALEPLSQLPADALLAGLDPEALKAQARAGRPELVQARLGLEQSRLQLEQARIQKRPRLSLEASYTPEGAKNSLSLSLDDRALLQATLTRVESEVELIDPSAGQPLPPSPESWKVGLQVTWNLLDGGASAAAVREAEEAVTQAELTVRQLEAAITLELAQHQTGLTQALLTLAAAERSVTEAAGRLAQVEQQAHEGAATKLQVWEAEAALAQARLKQVQALAELARARTRLAIAAGYDAEQLQALITARAPGGM
ncbi:TolC family protein [Limnochorda pilosa]|uniref:TolC family protein n=3 Tax=Limnochorda TaxID=1676651 RepID=UPI0026E94C2B|nr:TolC family protein [Limnochorda pilosa]